MVLAVFNVSKSLHLLTNTSSTLVNACCNKLIAFKVVDYSINSTTTLYSLFISKFSTNTVKL